MTDVLTQFGPESSAARLLCLPHAGASGDAFAAWPRDLAGALEVWAVTPSGRRHRSTEPLNEDIAQLVSEVVDELDTEDDRPVMIFGHSMGGLVGYELSLALDSLGRPPAALVVSGCPAPHIRSVRTPQDYSDEELAATLMDWGGTDRALVEDPMLRRLTFPPLRADLRLCDRYARTEPIRLHLPLSVLGGRADTVAPLAGLGQWVAYSDNFQGVTTFPGGHFFVTSSRRRVVDHVADLALRVLAAR